VSNKGHDEIFDKLTVQRFLKFGNHWQAKQRPNGNDECRPKSILL
jgi:hypothetical protein